MKCVLCSGTLWREDDEGNMWCSNCGAAKGGAPDPWGRTLDELVAEQSQRIAAERREEQTFLRDVNAGPLDRRSETGAL